jgi:amino acid transporter
MSIRTDEEVSGSQSPGNDPASEAAALSRSKLPLWAVLALSLAIVGPTLAMSGNGQSLAASVGKSIPLVLLIGVFAVGLVAYGFARLSQHMSHSGSVYALVGRTVGPRAGFFSGFAMIGTYIGFSIGTAALFASFTNALLAALQPWSTQPYQLPWIIPTVVAVAAAMTLIRFDTRTVMSVLLGIEAIGIAFMIVLSVVIFARGGAHAVNPTAPGVDWSVFTFSGVSPEAVIGGIVVAFLTWAGFEGCTTLGEESQNPKRDIPRVLVGTLALTGVLFVTVMFAETVGFGVDEAGSAAFARSGNSLGELGTTFVGHWFGAVIIITGMMSSFASCLASTETSGRLLQAFARDGFGPRALARSNRSTGAPRAAEMTVLIIVLVVTVICWATGWPGGDQGPIAVYGEFATAGAVALMVAYFMVEVAACWFITAPKFRRVVGTRGRLAGVIVTTVGAVFIVVVIGSNIAGTVVDGEVDWLSPVYIGLAWCAAGLVIAVTAGSLTRRIGGHLAREIELVETVPADGSVGGAVSELGGAVR